MNPRLLFILKRREADWGSYSTSLSSGLRNSVSFVTDMMGSMGVQSQFVEVQDNNEIDREVTTARPTHVVIEAFWVVPEKFDVLIPLHRNIRWIVRNHSETPFLANEGIATEWIAGYLSRNVEVMCNSPRALADIRGVAHAFNYSDRLVSYGPNFYPIGEAGPVTVRLDHEYPIMRIGCFGAIRPLKNQYSQAIAAIGFARSIGKRLEFHINGSRIEGNGDPILKNLRALFAATHDATLVEHPWMPHPEFRGVVAGMDIVMQVSFSETFNIVAADAVAGSVPVVCSSEVPWLGSYAHADPTDVDDIAHALFQVWLDPNLLSRLHQQRRDLRDYNIETERAWLRRFQPKLLPELGGIA